MLRAGLLVIKKKEYNIIDQQSADPIVFSWITHQREYEAEPIMDWRATSRTLHHITHTHAASGPLLVINCIARSPAA